MMVNEQQSAAEHFDESVRAGQRVRLFVTFHPLGYSTQDISDLRQAVDDIERGAALLERLAVAGWEIEFDGVDQGIADYAACREFATPLEAFDAAAALGADGHRFEWPGELEYFTIDDWDRDWIIANYGDMSPMVSDDQLPLF